MDKYQKTSICSLGITIATAITYACGTPPAPEDVAITEESETSSGAESTAPPQFRVDPFWPRPLPNNWMLGQVAGLAVSNDDNIWIIHRPNTLDARQRGEEGMCCVPAPPIIEFAPDGSVQRSWGGPGDDYEWPESEHGIYVDANQDVWIGGNAPNDSQILKFTSDGEFILQIGRAGQSGGSNDTDNLGRPAGFTIDENANEVYVADGYGNRRIIVFDNTTGAYKRHWGAYGETPHDEPLPAYDSDAEPIRQYRSPVHDVTISTDGLVYVADRTNNRLQLFQKDRGTKAICMIGEIGGTAEDEAAYYIKKHVTNPVVGFIAGQTAPPGRRMGHAGAIISGGRGTASEKMRVLRDANVKVVESPAEIGTAIATVLGP